MKMLVVIVDCDAIVVRVDVLVLASTDNTALESILFSV